MAGLSQADYDRSIAEGQVAVAVCHRCGSQQAMPSETCFTCGSDEVELRAHDGGGRAFTWVVCHYAFAEEYRQEVPYTVVLTALDGGGRVYGRYAAGEPPLEPGMRLVLDAAATVTHGFLVYKAAV